MTGHTSLWEKAFEKLGYPDAQPLAAGMEGVVYQLGGGTIGKVWAQRSGRELQQLQHVLSNIDVTRLSFQLPEIFDVVRANGKWITIEKELSGTPLKRYVSANEPTVTDDIANSVSVVLTELARISATTTMQRLPVLNEDRPLWGNNRSWAEALKDLVERRVMLFGNQLERHVTNFDTRLAAVLSLIEALDDVPLSLVHGDLVPENILVDDFMRPTAVLDFGFFSTGGDPRLDAAIAVSTCDMYGPHAHEIGAQLTTKIVQYCNYGYEVLTLYKAIYAIVTSNVYDEMGEDGHFAWCAQTMERDDVTCMLIG